MWGVGGAVESSVAGRRAEKGEGVCVGDVSNSV